MAVCFLCEKIIPNEEIVKLRKNNYVCKACIKARELILNNIKQEKLILESSKNKLNNLFEKVAFYFSIIIVILIFLGIQNGIKINYFFTIFLLLFVWGVFSLAIKFKIKKNSLKSEIIKEKEANIFPIIKKELDEIYKQFYGLPPDWPERRIRVYSREKGICQNCKMKIPGTFHVHHKIPKSKEDGNHGLDNLILLCPKCHSKIDYPGHQRIKTLKKKVLKAGKRNKKFFP